VCCRIRLPKGGVGRDYVLVQLTVNGKGPYDFMLDSGASGGQPREPSQLCALVAVSNPFAGVPKPYGLIPTSD